MFACPFSRLGGEHNVQNNECHAPLASRATSH